MKASITILSLLWVLLQLCLVAPKIATALTVEEDHPEERGGSLRPRELSRGGNNQKCGLFKPCQRGLKCLAFKGKCTDGNDGSLCTIHGDCDSKKCQSGKCAPMVKTPTAPTRPRGNNSALCGIFAPCARGLKCLPFLQMCTNGWNGSPCIFNGDCKDSRICSKGRCAERQTSAPTAAPTTVTPLEDVVCPCWDYQNDLIKTFADRLISFVVAGEEVFIHAITGTKDFDGSMSGIYMVDTPEDDTGTGDPAFWVKSDESSGTECSYTTVDGDTIAEIPLDAAQEGACRSDIRNAVKEAATLFTTAILKTSLADGTCPCEEPRSDYSGTIELELMLHGPGHQEALIKFGDEEKTVEASVVVENGSETITCDAESIDLTEISKAEFGSCAKPVLDAM